jgi:purine-nucleoside phosphorylase
MYNETIEFIRSKTQFVPKIGIVLGSGLGNVADDIQIECKLSYNEIPGFIGTTIPGHHGNLIFGYLEGTPIVAMQGRNHYYEGHTMQQITYPIRIMKLLGIERLITSNATGGMNERYEIGDIMFVNDHINLMNGNPLIGPNDENFGPRFLDVSKVYDSEMIEVAKKHAINENIKVHEGVLVALTGPAYETPAEYRFLRIIGADAVGMSTIPEVLVGRHMGLKVFSMSLITDLGIPGKIVEITHEEVQQVAAVTATKMGSIVRYLVKHYK